MRRRSAAYNRSLVHGPLQLSIDDSAYDSIKLHGYTLHELIGFLPTDIQESTAPFIHPLLRNGIEDVNQINAAVCYLRAQLELLANPQCLFLKANVDKARDLWSKAIRVNALLVREASKLLYARDQDNLKVEARYSTCCVQERCFRSPPSSEGIQHAPLPEQGDIEGSWLGV